MSSSEEKKMEKEKEICIGDSNGNNSSHRNWCSDLPMDALLLIMSKVGAIDILTSAQWVCKNWGKVCGEVPSLWRSIDMTPKVHSHDRYLSSMAREAIDRSQGNVQQFDIRYLGEDSLFYYLAHSTSCLRRLRIISAYAYAYGFNGKSLAESVSRFPLLEELDISFTSFGKQACELVGKACPHLKSFRYNQIYENCFHFGSDDADAEALGIANYMPNLRRLQIVRNRLTNAGLMTILDKCVHLRSLDLHCCLNINMNASLQARCARIEDFRLDPHG